jgi:cysteine desulfurase
MRGDSADRYFDYAAAAPPFPEALNAQAQAAERWFGNPSAAHGPGRAARAELERLRRRLAELCGFAGGRLVLTSGATEANNWAIHGTLAHRPAGRILVAPDVHASVWNVCLRYPGRIDSLPVDRHGRIRLRDLTAGFTADTCLVCCSHAASETGIVQDAGAIAAVCERRGVDCLVDGTQACGRIPVDLSAIAADFYVFSAHKFGGPRGCGGVFVRAHSMPPLMDGGAQEWGLRPGTENLPALAGAVAALERSLALMTVETERLRELTRTVSTELERSGAPFHVNGDPEATAPGFLSLTFPNLDGHALVADLAVQGFAIASGSACSANRPEPSRAILALGRSSAEALGTVRISFGRSSAPAIVEAFARALVKTVRRQTGQ